MGKELCGTVMFVSMLLVPSLFSACTSSSTIPEDSAGIRFTKSGQTLGDTRTFGLAVGDVDLDGDNDIFLSNLIGESELWLNDGKGRFVQHDQGFLPAHDVALVDLNGDRLPDVFLVCHDTPSKVYFNGGDGVFRDSGQDIGATEEYPGAIVMGDVDGDGDMDAFISHYQIPNRLWINDGKGFFAKSDQEFGVDGNPGHMELTDLNGDSYPDLFLCMTEAPDQVWLNDGKGHFTNTGQALGTDLGNDAPHSVDLDDDGDNDVVVGNNREGLKIWLNQNNTGTLVEAGGYFGDPSLILEFCDADLDGDSDLITIHREDGNLLWLNDGRGTFTSMGAVFGDASVLSAACRDLDGDRSPDVVFGQTEGTGGNSIYINGSDS